MGAFTCLTALISTDRLSLNRLVMYAALVSIVLLGLVAGGSGQAAPQQQQSGGGGAQPQQQQYYAGYPYNYQANQQAQAQWAAAQGGVMQHPMLPFLMMRENGGEINSMMMW